MCRASLANCSFASNSYGLHTFAAHKEMIVGIHPHGTYQMNMK